MIGVGSWDVLHIGLTNTLGLTIGTWSIIVGLIILAIDDVYEATAENRYISRHGFNRYFY